MIDAKKLFELIAERINNPTNVKLSVHAVVKEIPDSKHGSLTTLVLYNTVDKDASAVDERIIDDADLYEQNIIEGEE